MTNICLWRCEAPNIYFYFISFLFYKLYMSFIIYLIWKGKVSINRQIHFLYRNHTFIKIVKNVFFSNFKYLRGIFIKRYEIFIYKNPFLFIEILKEKVVILLGLQSFIIIPSSFFSLVSCSYDVRNISAGIFYIIRFEWPQPWSLGLQEGFITSLGYSFSFCCGF